MENFAFRQFLGQLYQLSPELQEYDEFVRQFLREELKGRKSFVVQSSVAEKAYAYVQKRINVTKVGGQMQQNDAMLFAKIELEENIIDSPKQEFISNYNKDSVGGLKQGNSDKTSSLFGVFVFGFIIGGLVVGSIFVYNLLAENNGLPQLF